MHTLGFIIKPPDHEFTDIPANILGDAGFMPHIKVIISTLTIIYILINIHWMSCIHCLIFIFRIELEL